VSVDRREVWEAKRRNQVNPTRQSLYRTRMTGMSLLQRFMEKLIVS